MPIGFNMRIMPGVRISASSRGIRAGIGPRATRLHVGSGGIGASTGVGPFTAYTGTGRRRSRQRSSLGSSLKAYERELRLAQREQEIAEAAKKEQQLVSVHLEEFPSAQPQKTPAPAPVDRRAVLKESQRQALDGVSLFKWSERRAAKQAATQRAERTIREEERQRADAQAEEQARLDVGWQRLTNNDPQTVLVTLEEAFEDNKAPAAPINCEGDEVTVMMLYESPELIPEHKPASTPSGKPTLRKRKKTERNELYAASLASNALATAKEAFAVAPGISRVAVMVVRKDESPQTARPVLSCLYCGRFERRRFQQLDWSRVDPLVELSNSPDALIERKGRTVEVAPLNLSDAPDLAAVLRSAADALDCEASIGSRSRGRRKSTSPKRANLADELREIAELRDAGALTDEEFRRAKKELLG